jgi:hypothetical protein
MSNGLPEGVTSIRIEPPPTGKLALTRSKTRAALVRLMEGSGQEYPVRFSASDERWVEDQIFRIKQIARPVIDGILEWLNGNYPEGPDTPNIDYALLIREMEQMGFSELKRERRENLTFNYICNDAIGRLFEFSVLASSPEIVLEYQNQMVGAFPTLRGALSAAKRILKQRE